ncbi:diguanylate cyclase [Rhodopseudomonas palustris]|uniref:diguanylate cyclase n=1 Tax=Rhodopseudomonas palustris TaxID=1076 RepID=A0A323URA7_RHOPL|nr:diguanylate cyclase [Rhodopseudomonas palustris]PZA10198.1 diguanylate cyclase [Rhodopseudomonas palustris]
MNMQIDVDRDWKDRVSARALEQIRELDLSLDPESFELWYTFFAGRHKALTEAIDALLAAKPRPTSRDIADLYERVLFPAKAATRIEAIGAEVQTQSSRLIDVIAQASDATQGYQSRLSSAAPRLAGGGSEGGVAAIVDDLLQWTIEMRATNALLVERLGSAAAQVRQLQDQLDQVRLESMTDPLTEVGNRKYFETLLSQHVASDGSAPLSLLVVDLDNFKQFNDRHGHVVGDDVLRLAASAIKHNCRRDDLVCRYGGDEFAVILPRTPLREALLLGETIRAAIAARELHRRSTHESLGRLMVSIGAAEFRPGERAEDLVERADHWMYVAKQARRDRAHPCADAAAHDPAERRPEILWHESYACGEPTIDAQHRELFDLANVLLGREIDTLEPSKLREFVDLLLGRVAEHFQDEQAVLEAARYDECALHRTEHDHLLIQARQISEAVVSGNQPLAELRTFLVNSVILGHMLKDDRRFFPLFDPHASSGLAVPSAVPHRERRRSQLERDDHDRLV